MERAVPGNLVVVGASAGGVDALSTLVGSLPADFPAPVVIAQHLDPRHASHLHEILGRRAQVPVRTVVDHEHLAAGTVYVVPAQRHVEIRDGEVRLVKDAGRRPQPSIDLLLGSAAQVYGEHLTAVILTGSGSDGADGARRVKAAGGTVVVQNPATAEFPSMPQSLAPTTVDVVADLDAIGPLLVDLAREPRLHHPELGGGELVETFLNQLRDQSGIDFAGYKRPTILRRLQRRMAATGSGDLPQYVAHLQKEPEELQRLTSSFLLKVTEFFRDAEFFDRLRTEWLPELMADARRRGDELRIWSAGCATGEEAYSLAMLVAEAIGGGEDPPRVRIFATDLDEAAISFARRGVYPLGAFTRVPDDLRDAYVRELNGDAEVTKDVRSLVIFGQHDLGHRAPFPRIDLVLCRNVLIYFQPELQRRALELFAFSIRDGGLLALGKAETTAAVRGSFRLIDRRMKVYRRHGPRASLPPMDPGPAMVAPQLIPARHVAPALDLAVMRARADAEQKRTGAERADRVLLGLRTGIVVVDEHYDISRINAAAREMLSIHGTAIGDDLVHLAVGLPTAPLRALIDAAIEGQAANAILPLGTSATEAGDGAQLEVTATRIAGYPSGERAVVVELRDVTKGEERRADLEERIAADAVAAERARLNAARDSASKVELLESAVTERDRRLSEQAGRLKRITDTQRQLLAANRELTDTNSVLRSSNDELLISNEEVQASSEEVETLNEELQATNEELETLNEELQATIEELNSTNSELEARSAEIEQASEDLADAREASERGRQELATTVASMDDAVMRMGADGRSLVTNRAFDSLFSDPDAEIEAHDGEPPTREALEKRVRSGETFRTQFAIRAKDGARRWFEARGRPVQGDGNELGGVVVIRDITDRSLRELQDQFVAMVAHELRTPLTALSGYVELLRRQLPDERDDADERLRRFADRAVGQARRMSELVNDLLDANRLQRGGLEYVRERIDLAALVNEMVEISLPAMGDRKVTVQGADVPVWVIGDPGRLQQVVMNLLTNARDHGGGRIEVELRPSNDFVELIVRDHGKGIPREEISNLFTRFFQGGGSRRWSGGLGLGLYISREIVEAHGGTITATSKSRQGATFTVTLPIARARGQRASRGTRARGKPGGDQHAR